MKINLRKLMLVAVLLIVCAAAHASGQDASSSASPPAPPDIAAMQTRVALVEPALAFDNSGTQTLAGRLVTPVENLRGEASAPVLSVRLTLENRLAQTIVYASGWATFYDQAGVRCGEGLWVANQLAPNERFETDAPGLRLTCAPVQWRISTLNLIMRAAQ